jgi:hypothetical protein
LSLGGHLSGEDYQIVSDRRQAFRTHQNDMARLYEKVLPEGTISLDATALAADVHRQIAGRVIDDPGLPAPVAARRVEADCQRTGASEKGKT